MPDLLQKYDRRWKRIRSERAELRPTDGLHPLRDRRGRRAAELERVDGPGELDGDRMRPRAIRHNSQAIRRVYGRQLGIAGANGGYSYVALFYRNNRLYQVEGIAFAAGGRAEVDAMRFQQSLDLT